MLVLKEAAWIIKTWNVSIYKLTYDKDKQALLQLAILNKIKLVFIITLVLWLLNKELRIKLTLI